MKIIHRINRFLSQSIALLNAGLAVFLVLIATVGSMGTMSAAAAAADIPIFLGLLAGAVLGLLIGGAVAVMVCGLLAVLINIRDLLAASLDQRPAPANPRFTKE